MSIKTSISTLSGSKNIKEIENSNADFIHCDEMDGIFVKNNNYDLEYVKKIRSVSSSPVDVHLMVQNPKVEDFFNIANIITVHYECFNTEKLLIKTLKKIRKNKTLAGLSFDINTLISNKLFLLKYCDLVLIMSVKAGLGGQQFDESAITKIQVIKDYIKTNNLKTIIEVDGGISLKNIAKIKNAGADVVVLGKSFSEAKDKQDFIKKIKE